MTTTKRQPLTLHRLIGEVSYWGTMSRLLLAVFLTGITYIVILVSDVTTTANFSNETIRFLYVLASFIILDFGYVTISRARPVRLMLDVLILLLADIFIVSMYVIPQFVSVTNYMINALWYMFAFVIFVIAGRLLIGLLYTRRS